LPGHCLPESDTLFGGRNLMAVPIPGRDGDILGILVVGDKEERGGRITAFTDEDVILLDSFAKQGGVAIENARLHQEALEARQLQAEMEEARKIQENLIPDMLPDIPGYEVAGHYEPRGPVGGDYYDCIALPTGRWGLAIADVSGKGMQAALLMATLRAGLISELSRVKNIAVENVEQDASTQGPLYAEIADMAMTLNSLLYASGTEEKYATFFYSHLNPETDILTTLNAGHNPPLLVKKDGTYKWLGEEVGGIPLGMFPNDMVSSIAEYEAEHVELTSGDVVVYYTDGVTETVNVDDDYYDEERLVEASIACKDEDAEGIRASLHKAVMDFQGEADQFDDLTLLILRKK
ncbi:SpoIIE family protein phosphatase, partial [Candidatus Poribacteria bacterium]|nr:SpoIIE family protein phosphatase [Candidatus Poribacteria bacterium]